ncbi:invasion associated locus B family protein [Phyllobacterium sp. YR531]|uniref:invasion associated locus B family protein n=1 Tax=Phyllobacterium sp. YR531 TaxID=1144343 RepID=UPI00026F87A6|nr:invasion associated locus B family protein [Phyllobacterium sp. YR531]EJM98937.1 Invasion associated locus B (IalB) protein [Phyllobacterium sp. YR531]
MKLQTRQFIGYLVCIILSGALPAAGQELPVSDYSIKPSEVVIPQGAELGSYRRTVQPFENWELRCDENLKAKKKICNVTQTILDQAGQFAFSWSLAATEDGKPLMILRTRPELGDKKPIALRFSGRKEPVIVETNGCDAAVCVAILPVGPVIREQIAKAAIAQISYEISSSGSLVFNAPLQGLATAVAAIK